MDIVVIVCVSLAVGLAVGFGKSRLGSESGVKGGKVAAHGASASKQSEGGRRA